MTEPNNLMGEGLFVTFESYADILAIYKNISRKEALLIARETYKEKYGRYPNEYTYYLNETNEGNENE